MKIKVKHYNVGKNNPMFGNHRFGADSPNFGNYKYNITKKFLIKEYIKNKKSKMRIAKELGCSITSVYNRLKKYNISIRTRGEARKIWLKDPRNHPNFGKSGKNAFNYIDGRSAKTYYCIDKNCNNEICYENWRRGSRKCYSCANSGKNNPSYIDGLSGLPYPIEWTETLKESIRQRDNYICQKCGKKQLKLKGLFKKLSVHHIDYNKENLDPSNLITLCQKCNMIANKNRDYWFAYYSYIMKNKGGD